jgi:hypothetical protein
MQLTDLLNIGAPPVCQAQTLTPISADRTISTAREAGGLSDLVVYGV